MLVQFPRSTRYEAYLARFVHIMQKSRLFTVPAGTLRREQRNSIVISFFR